MELDTVGRMLLVVGLVLAGLGLVVILGARLPFLGRLPGDISWRWSGGSFYFPIVTCLVLSILLSVVLNIVLRLLNRS
jgi:cytochrome c biogenesis factor